MLVSEADFFFDTTAVAYIHGCGHKDTSRLGPRWPGPAAKRTPSSLTLAFQEYTLSTQAYCRA